MAAYDLPANIQYVLNATGASRLAGYVGHSQVRFRMDSDVEETRMDEGIERGELERAGSGSC